MSLNRDIFNIVKGIERQHSCDDLSNYVHEILKPYGVDWAAVVECPSAEVSCVLIGQPSEWWAHYTKQEYALDDPILRAAQKSSASPISWLEVESSVSEGSNASRVLKESKDFGLTGGLSFPVIGKNGCLAVVSYFGPRIDKRPEVMRALDLISTYIYRQLKKIQRSDPETKDRNRLTPRERECVEWIARGKSDVDVSEILNVSRHTVRVHIERARKKLRRR